MALAAGCGGGNDGTTGGDPLEGTSWELQHIRKTQALAEVTVTATFTDGRISGSGGCNNYFAEYEALGNRLTIGAPGSTMMACPEEIMAQERLVLSYLENAQTFVLMEDGRLQILRDDHEALTFVPAAGTGN